MGTQRGLRPLVVKLFFQSVQQTAHTPVAARSRRESVALQRVCGGLCPLGIKVTLQSCT